MFSFNLWVRNPQNESLIKRIYNFFSSGEKKHLQYLKKKRFNFDPKPFIMFEGAWIVWLNSETTLRHLTPYSIQDRVVNILSEGVKDLMISEPNNTFDSKDTAELAIARINKILSEICETNNFDKQILS